MDDGRYSYQPSAVSRQPEVVIPSGARNDNFALVSQSPSLSLLHAQNLIVYRLASLPCGLACKSHQRPYNEGNCGKSGKKWGKVGKTVDNCGLPPPRQVMKVQCF